VPRKENIETIKKLKTVISEASGIYFADSSKVKAKDMATLRRRLKESQVVTKVVKNRLAILAFKELGYNESVRSFLTGSTSLIITRQDPITPAKLIKDLTKKFAELKIKGAYVDSTVFPAEQFNYLANLPTRPELQATLVWVLNQPIYGIVAVLDNLLSKLVVTLEEISQKKPNEEALKEQN
jgi:large subunit ribosomal protein L10